MSFCNTTTSTRHVDELEPSRNTIPEPVYADSWYKIYLYDRCNIFRCLVSNLESDIEDGYSPDGITVDFQIAGIADVAKKMHETCKMLKSLSAAEREQWCYNALVESGAIE